ncbi:ATP-binding cassette domain-containing protein [Bdellovibrio sp. HCB2-146]|uniref:ATP-binding cassette domain-containing protein n=1 Tax=Bdellovibrio sp. HCB2-146 TaxID=3394362 RepID=UPI0039BCA53D
MKTLIDALNLQAFSREGTPLSPAISFELYPGQVLYFTGENGAGKSTLLKTILGLHRFYQGHLRVHTPQSKIQYLPQLGNLNFHIPCTLQDMLDVEATHMPLLANLDLSKKWNTASGGERQKVLLASALLKEPELLVLDEPFNHVDKEASLLLENSLQDYLQAHPQSSLVIVSHRVFVRSWQQVRFLEIK